MLISLLDIVISVVILAFIYGTIFWAIKLFNRIPTEEELRRLYYYKAAIDKVLLPPRFPRRAFKRLDWFVMRLNLTAIKVFAIKKKIIVDVTVGSMNITIIYSFSKFFNNMVAKFKRLDIDRIEQGTLAFGFKRKFIDTLVNVAMEK